MTKGSSKAEYYCDFGHRLQPGIAGVWYCACFGGFYVRYKFAKGWGNKRITLQSLMTGFKPLSEQAIRAMLRTQIRHMLTVQVDNYKPKPKPLPPIDDDEIPF